MARRSSGFRKPRALPQPSPTGWSFYSSAIRCWYAWALKYVFGIAAPHIDDALATGIVFHAMQDGIPESDIMSWGEDFRGENFDMAKKIFEARKKGAPVPKPLQREMQLEMPAGHPLEGVFTSKPDAIEPALDADKRVREYKTTRRFRDEDEDHWRTNGGVIGELIASGCTEAIVDVTSKTNPPRVQQFQVLLDENKEQALTGVIEYLVEQVRSRMARWETTAARDPRSPDAVAIFPRTGMAHACTWPRRCEYYDWCWSNGSAKHLYNKVEPPSEWRKRLLEES